MPFIIKVAGAYVKYPAKRSASAEPRPADKNIYPWGRRKADAKTTASPRFIYPPRGEGNLIIIVATQVSDELFLHARNEEKSTCILINKNELGKHPDLIEKIEDTFVELYDYFDWLGGRLVSLLIKRNPQLAVEIFMLSPLRSVCNKLPYLPPSNQNSTYEPHDTGRKGSRWLCNVTNTGRLAWRSVGTCAQIRWRIWPDILFYPWRNHS